MELVNDIMAGLHSHGVDPDPGEKNYKITSAHGELKEINTV